MPNWTRSLFLSAIGAALLPGGTWQIDSAHSGAHFAVKHMMVSTVRGEFGGVKGTVEYDAANPSQAKIDVAIDTTTINTREAKRDAHLKTADFFDVEKHPTMTFKSKKVEQAGQGKLKVTGDLTLRGVTKEVVLDVEGPSPEIKDQRGNARIGASATTKLNRKDFGVNWSRTLDGGGIVVGDEVQVTIDVELVQRAAQPAQTN